MTATQTKMYYVDKNEDGSQTIKGILEFVNSDNEEGFIVYRIYVKPNSLLATVFVSDLVGCYGAKVFPDFEQIANLLYQKHLIQYKQIDLSRVTWIHHEGKFDGTQGRVDIRDPYGTDVNDYTQLLARWDEREKRYEFAPREQNSYVYVPNPEQIELYPAHLFGRVNEITSKLGWHRNTNRLDVEYSIERINPDGSTILKTIFFWEHPDYPSNCLVRIWLREKDVIIIMTELRSNIPLGCNEGFQPNTIARCMLQVVNGIYTKYLDRLEKYPVDCITWFYEEGELSTFNDQINWGRYNSVFEFVKIYQNEYKKAEFTTIEIDEYDEKYTGVQNLLRGEPFGTIEESLKELGWNNF